MNRCRNATSSKYRNNYFFRKFGEEGHFPKTLVRRDHRLLHEYQDLSFLRDPLFQSMTQG
jgi:hypothetical protein